jgi:hypothetical protein
MKKNILIKQVFCIFKNLTGLYISTHIISTVRGREFRYFNGRTTVWVEKHYPRGHNIQTNITQPKLESQRFKSSGRHK